MSPRLAIILSSALLASGCTITSDLGHGCVLQKSKLEPVLNDDGTQKTDKDGKPIFKNVAVDILENELVPGQDYIAFGVTDCEDLICVRDAAVPIIVDDPTTANKDESKVGAAGYCSKACGDEDKAGENSANPACEVTTSEVSNVLKDRPMGCHSLLLDQDSLDALRKSDPETYRNTFGDTNSPLFCVVR